jgi:hypothetical protein
MLFSKKIKKAPKSVVDDSYDDYLLSHYLKAPMIWGLGVDP